MKQYKIIPEENITLGEVRNLTRAGNHITLTPHIGNIWRANMAVVDLGVTVTVYEGNCHTKDTDEFPGYLRKDGQSIPLVDEERPIMSTHLQLMQGLDIPYLNQQSLGRTPAQIHYNAIRKALPPEMVVLFAEHCFTSDSEVREMLNYLVKFHHIFTRKVDSNGLIENVDYWEENPFTLVENFIQLKKAQIKAIYTGEKPELEGPLASNRLNVMLLGIKAFLEKKRKGALMPEEYQKFTAYAVSGRSMINYTKDPEFQTEIERMYSLLRQGFPYLPAELVLKMLPGSNLRFVTAPNEEPFELIKEIGRQNIKIADQTGVIKSTSFPEAKQLEINKASGLRSDLNKLIDEMWRSAPWNHFYSQHDALCNGGRTMIPEEIIGMTFKQLAVLSNPKPRT